MARQPRQLAGIGASDLPNQASVDAYKGPPREIIIGTETIHIQDGETPGGIPLARRSDVALKLDKTLPLAGDLLSRPAEGKIRERKSLLDFIDPALHASIADGTIASTVDLSDALAKAAAYVRAGLGRLVIPSGVYPYSVSPQWAVSMGRIDIEGEVRFRYTGTGRAFILNQGTASTTVHTYNMHVGKPSAPLIIEAGAGADHAVFAKAINHSELHFVVRGCGPNSAALYTEGGVCSNYGLVASVNESGWYQGAKPGFGWIAAGLTGEGAAGQCSYVILKDPKIEGVAKGAVLRFALGSGIVGGTIEGCSDYAIDILAGCDECIIERHDLEANGGFDIRDNGRGTRIVNCDSTAKNLSHQTTSGILIGGASVSAQIKGGRHNTVIVLAGAKGLRAMMFDIGRDGDGNMSIQAGATVYRRGVFNRQTQAFLPDLDGDASSVSASATGLSTPRILADWLKYPISLERFGCKGDFNGTTGTDNQTRLQQAIASGEQLVLPPGARYLTGAPLAVTNQAFQMTGGYRSSALVFAPGVSGGVIKQDKQENATHIENVAFLTLGQEAGTGLSVTYAAADSGNFRNDVRCNLKNITVRGVNYLQHGWDIGIETIDVHNLQMENPNVVGRRDFDADNGGRLSFGTMDLGIRNFGSSLLSIPSDGLIFNPRVANAKLGMISEGQVEGFRVLDPIIIAVWQAIEINNASERPWGRIAGGHLSPIDLGIRVINCPDMDISDILFIKGSPAGVLSDGTPGTLAIRAEKCNGIRVKRLKFQNYSTGKSAGGAWNGIELKDCQVARIAEIEHFKPTTGLKLLGTTDRCKSKEYECLSDYEGETARAEYVDLSSGTQNVRVEGNLPAGRASNAGAISVSGTVNNSVSIFVPGAEVGQRYRIDAHVQLQVGGTAGQANIFLQNDGGGAGGGFDDNAAYIAERRDVAANTTQEIHLTGVYRVTARGSIVMKLGLQTLSTTGTISAGRAQMSATLL